MIVWIRDPANLLFLRTAELIRRNGLFPILQSRRQYPGIYGYEKVSVDRYQATWQIYFLKWGDDRETTIPSGAVPVAELLQHEEVIQ